MLKHTYFDSQSQFTTMIYGIADLKRIVFSCEEQHGHTNQLRVYPLEKLVSGKTIEIIHAGLNSERYLCRCERHKDERSTRNSINLCYLKCENIFAQKYARSKGNSCASDIIYKRFHTRKSVIIKIG